MSPTFSVVLAVPSRSDRDRPTWSLGEDAMGRRPLAVYASVLLAAVLPTLSTPDALAQPPKRGGVLRIADREAPTPAPTVAVSFLPHSWAGMVYSQLFPSPQGPEQKPPADFTIVPDLAEKWEYK